MGTPADVLSGGATPPFITPTAASTAAATASSAAPTTPDAAPVQPVQPAQPAPQPAPDNRSVASKVIGAIGDILGGKSVDKPSYDDNGVLQHHKVDLTRKQQVGNILGNGLRGLATGMQQHGAGAGMKAFGAGADAVMNHDEQVKQQALKQADTEYNAKQTALNNQAHRSYLGQEKASLAWQMQESQIKMSNETQANEAQLEKDVAAGGGEDLGTYPNLTEALKAYPTGTQGAAKDHAAGVIMPVTVTDAQGNPTVHVFRVKPSFWEQRIDHDVTLQVPDGMDIDPATKQPRKDKDGIPQLHYSTVTIPAGSATHEDLFKFTSAHSINNYKSALDAFHAKTEKINAQANQERVANEGKEINARVAALTLEIGDKKQAKQANDDYAAALQEAGNDPAKANQILQAKYPKSYGVLSAAENLDMAKNGEKVTQDINGVKTEVKRQRLFTAPAAAQQGATTPQVSQALTQMQANKVQPAEAYGYIQQTQLSPQEKLQLVKASGAPVPASEVQRMAKASGVSPQVMETQLKAQGFQIEQAAAVPMESYAGK